MSLLSLLPQVLMGKGTHQPPGWTFSQERLLPCSMKTSSCGICFSMTKWHQTKAWDYQPSRKSWTGSHSWRPTASLSPCFLFCYMGREMSGCLLPGLYKAGIGGILGGNLLSCHCVLKLYLRYLIKSSQHGLEHTRKLWLDFKRQILTKDTKLVICRVGVQTTSTWSAFVL